MLTINNVVHRLSYYTLWCTSFCPLHVGQWSCILYVCSCGLSLSLFVCWFVIHAYLTIIILLVELQQFRKTVHKVLFTWYMCILWCVHCAMHVAVHHTNFHLDWRPKYIDSLSNDKFQVNCIKMKIWEIMIARYSVHNCEP